MTCTHTRDKYVKRHIGNDIYTDEPLYEEKWVEINTYEDIDLHRFRCTQCGLVRYYSNRARAYYEEGKGDLS